ncbi:MAG: AMP-binding protein [Candidatus Omnitrophota bacterium]
MNIAKHLETQAQKYKHRAALIFKNQPISFVQLQNKSYKLTDSLIKLGVKKGDKIAMYLPNCPEYIYSYLAIWSIGATAIPLDFMLTEAELASCMSHSQTKILITKSKPNLFLMGLKKKCDSLKEIILIQEKKDNFLSFDDLLAGGSDSIQIFDIPDKDLSCIFYTSGTTGKPKGVLCNYLQVGAPAKSMEYFVNIGQEDVALCGALPFSHLGGLVFIHCMVFLGAQVILMDRFIPLEFLKNLQDHKVTCFWLVPSMYYAILQLKEFETYDLTNLKWVVSFGAPSSPDQLKRFHKFCPKADLINGWGMTETQGPAVVLPRGSNKVESIGKPTPWMDAKIFDAGDKELPAGEIGELVVRSWVVTDGYYKDPDATAWTARNGWFHTGDLGKADTEGFLYIVGRKKEMIKVAGEIVFEPEVESAIHKHPQVIEVCVVGVQDNLRGEVPKAYIVLKEGSKLDENDLRYFCRKHLAHFKIPHYFEFRQSLPKNNAGKVDKESLRKESVS